METLLPPVIPVSSAMQALFIPKTPALRGTVIPSGHMCRQTLPVLTMIPLAQQIPAFWATLILLRRKILRLSVIQIQLVHSTIPPIRIPMQ